jgi:hypothetical protein
MQTEAIIATLLAAAAFLKNPIQDVAAQSIKDFYEAAKYYLRKKFGDGSDGAKFLDLALEKPESAMRKAVLVEEAASAGIESDPDLVGLIERLEALLPEAADPVWQHVHVAGRGNKVLVAGRDVIHTERVIRRTGIAPSEHHVTVEQRDQLRALIGELAVRMAGEDGKPNFAAGHRMLQREFDVVSYVLLPRDRFEEAMRFLKRRRAANRYRLRRRNPVAYATDLYRAIFSRAGELGWKRQQVYAFAVEKLGLQKPIASLKELGPNQVRSLVDLMRREPAPVPTP